MKKQFPADWTPVGVVQVPTFTERKPLLALGRSRRPGCTSQPRQVPHKDLTLVEEEEKEVSQEEDGALSQWERPLRGLRAGLFHPVESFTCS